MSFKYLPPQLADRLAGASIDARRAMSGALQGLHRSNRHGASVEFAEYRAYAPGDPPNLIDWSVYARSDRHLIRRFEEETNLVGYCLVDCSQSLAWRGLGAVSKLDYACSLAAAAMYVLVHQGDRVGLAAFAGKVVDRHAATGSAAGLRPLLEALERIRPGGRGDIGSALEECALFLPRRALVIVVSDFLQPAAQAVRGIRRLQHDGHDVRALHVVDRAELSLEGTGLVEATDLETGERIEVELDEVRDAYRDAVLAHCDEVRRACLGCGAQYHLVHTDSPVDGVFRGF